MDHIHGMVLEKTTVSRSFTSRVHLLAVDLVYGKGVISIVCLRSRLVFYVHIDFGIKCFTYIPG